MSDTAEMKIKALAPWFGGKRTMAPLIVTELGKHTQYFEPFCGSMSVLFAKQASQKETVNDLHGDLINLARVIQNETTATALYNRLQYVTFGEDLLDQARAQLDDESALSIICGQLFIGELPRQSIERAFWYFIASWMGRNGTAGTDRLDYQIAVRWTKSGGSPTIRWRNALESLPAWHRRLLNVVILRRDAFNIIDRLEDVQETAIYVDSPYAGETRGKIKDGRGGRYKHEFSHEATLWGDDDHTRLAKILSGYRKARVVISYYDCPRIRKLYDGWTIVEHTRQKHLHAQNGRGARPKDAPEILLINGPSYAKAA